MADHLKKLAEKFDVEQFRLLNSEISFSEYMDLVYKNPKLIRTSYQRIYDMILSKGTSKFERYRKTYIHYNFFDDPQLPIFGLEDALDQLVKFYKGAAGGYGPEKRFLLLHGPVGSSKSTICRLLKRNLEKYTRTDEGALYTYKWVNLPPDVYVQPTDLCPMHEDPLKLVPVDIRKDIVEELNNILREQASEEERSNLYTLKCEGELNPRCKKFMKDLMLKYNGDWAQVIDKHIRVVRCVHSEADRVGIATFQPKDEKNQDATELTGDVNFQKLGEYGVDSDPRAFNFDGEFQVGNRGMVEFIEVLKLDVAFLYDLLGACQEQSIKPKKFSQIHIDLALIGHTNPAEYEKLRGNETMEALRDRTVRIDIPYLLRWSEELKVLEHDYNNKRITQHIAPHTLEIAALWAILTRLEDDKGSKLGLLEKAKLYDGRALDGWTEDTVKELKDKHTNEGKERGVSCRYVQDKISDCLSSHHQSINAFMVLNALRDGLTQSSLISNQEDISRYIQCIELATKELDEILKREVQKALVGDEDAIVRLCANYIDNLMAYINNTKVKNPITGRDMQPDERLMRSIEEKIDVPDSNVDDFRRSLSTFIGSMAHQEKRFHWDSNPQLKKALEAKLFEDVKDHIKLSALSSKGATVVDHDLQEKIDAIKQRLIKQYGYNEQSATDVLDYVSSIFMRGDATNND